MQRTFIIIGHRAKTTSDFEFNDLPGSGGGIDTLSRCLATAFCLSNGIRKESRVFLILQGGKDAPKAIRFCGSELRGLNPDERSIAGIIRAALNKKAEMGVWAAISPGVYVSKASFGDVLHELSEEGATFIHLRESGVGLRDFEFPEDPCFILGDNTDLTESEEKALHAYRYRDVSVGPRSYHSDHCITMVQIEFDHRNL